MLLDVKIFIFHKGHRMAAVVVFVIIFSIDVATVKLLRLLHMLCYNKPCSLLLDVETHSAMSILCCSQLNLTVANCLYSIKFIHLLLFLCFRLAIDINMLHTISNIDMLDILRAALSFLFSFIDDLTSLSIPRSPSPVDDLWIICECLV